MKIDKFKIANAYENISAILLSFIVILILIGFNGIWMLGLTLLAMINFGASIAVANKYRPNNKGM